MFLNDLPRLNDSYPDFLLVDCDSGAVGRATGGEEESKTRPSAHCLQWPKMAADVVSGEL